MWRFFYCIQSLLQFFRVLNKYFIVCFVCFNCRPLLGCFRTPCFTGKQSTFFGHLVIDKLKLQMQRDMVILFAPFHIFICASTWLHATFSFYPWWIWFLFVLLSQREAVATSHCSQPNTLEYDMALEWSLLQERSDSAWGKLHEVYNIFFKIYGPFGVLKFILLDFFFYNGIIGCLSLLATRLGAEKTQG